MHVQPHESVGVAREKERKKGWQEIIEVCLPPLPPSLQLITCTVLHLFMKSALGLDRDGYAKQAVDRRGGEGER